MVSDLNAVWPIMSPDQFDYTGRALAREIRTTYTGRTWPTIAHLAKALKAALRPSEDARAAPRDSTAFDAEGAKQAAVEAWARGRRSCPPGFITYERLAAAGFSPSQVRARFDFLAVNLDAGIAGDRLHEPRRIEDAPE